MSKSLPVVKPGAEGLGRPTIMSRATAERHGVAYVHLAAFAIDVDRIAETVADDDVRWPFGWEVALTAAHLAQNVDPAESWMLIDDACASIVGGGDALGAQLPFAVWILAARGTWPANMGTLFTWELEPTNLLESASPLLDDAASIAALARACLAHPIDPPLADPTRAALTTLAETSTDSD